MQIHPTAIISKKAKLAEGILVGAYTIIGDDVVIGEGTKIGACCVIEGRTQAVNRELDLVSHVCRDLRERAVIRQQLVRQGPRQDAVGLSDYRA